MQSLLLRRIIERVSSHAKAVVRLNLLRLVKTLAEASIDPTRIAKQPNLLSTVSKLAESDPSLLVKNMAKEMLRDFAEAERKQKAVSTGEKSSIRRTWSDTAVSNVLAPANTASPRVRLKSRPHSPNLGPGALSPLSEQQHQTGSALAGPSRRISIRAKTSPPR